MDFTTSGPDPLGRRLFLDLSSELTRSKWSNSSGSDSPRRSTASRVALVSDFSVIPDVTPEIR